jgi:hypothetical protein
VPCRRAKAPCSSSTLRRGFRPRRSPTPTSRSRTTSRSSRSSTRSTCLKPTPRERRATSPGSWGTRQNGSFAFRPRRGRVWRRSSTRWWSASLRPAAIRTLPLARSSSTRPTTSTAAWSPSFASSTGSSARASEFVRWRPGRASRRRSSASSLPCGARPTRSRPVRWATSSPGSRTSAVCASGTRSRRRPGPRPRRCPATRT